MPNRVTKDQWLQAALDTLVEEGVEALRIERLAKRIGISRSGFYWHFKDSDDLRKEIVEYWAFEYTEKIINLLDEMPMDAQQKLQYTAQQVIKNELATYEIAMQTLAKTDPTLLPRINDVYQFRLDFVYRCFKELGFTGVELELRTRVFVVYASYELVFPTFGTREELMEQIPKHIELFTTKA
ncbi:MAG: TetR/AcrR family transcriptional regulator [Coraliomargarita sp.]